MAVALLLVTVIVSYRQTVRAYPHGGGAYIVARENLGDLPGLTAASALLIDYVLTVSVSIAAGVAAITSAAPGVAEYGLLMALGFVALVTIANLRGVKEAGLLFALPTYAFVVTMYVLVVSGLVQCLGGCPQAPTAGTELEVESTLTLFVILRAFSSGATALTGVEAITNGVPAFRYPQSRNAATTLGIMGCIAVTLFLGISYLATATNVVAFEGMPRTVTAQIALAVFGSGFGFYAVQVVTALILILAANTAYADFPRLSSVLTGDRFLPRQFAALGDRLVFSNGALVLAVAASLLLIVFDADVTQLIQLYVVGVFTSFTLSQAGMVRHWLKTQERNWRRSMVVNGIGSAVTGVVLVVVATTKFIGGAWIVIVAIPLVVLLMYRIHRHYQQVSLELRAGVAEPELGRPNHAVVLLDRVDESVAGAVSYMHAIAPASMQAFAVLPDNDVEARWAELTRDVPLRILRGTNSRDVLDAVREALSQERDKHPGAFTTAIVAETRSQSWVELLRHHRLALRLKAGLLAERDLVVTNILAPSGPGPYTVEEPVEHHVVVLVSGVHNATMRALAYAERLAPTSLRALSINLSTENSSRILYEWADWDLRIPLELLDSPFRSIEDSVRAYVRGFAPDGRRVVVTAVLREFIVPHWYHRPLHNQTALLVKGALLFERGVVVTSVPYPLHGTVAAQDAAPPPRRGHSRR